MAWPGPVAPAVIQASGTARQAGGGQVCLQEKQGAADCGGRGGRRCGAGASGWWPGQDQGGGGVPGVQDSQQLAEVWIGGDRGPGDSQRLGQSLGGGGGADERD